MRYKYETHCHTSIISCCAKITPQEIVDLYVKNGYSGVIITDHFINGNCRQDIIDEEDFSTKIHKFFEGYRQVKEYAKDKLDILYAFEYSYKGTDILVYGINENTLQNMPEIENIKTTEFIKLIELKGGLTIQAHPFREARYIDHIRIFPTVDGFEVFNSSRSKFCNKLAKSYHKIYNKNESKIKTAGSDLHNPKQKILSGMIFSSKIKSMEDFIKKLKNGEGKIFKQKNKY